MSIAHLRTLKWFCGFLILLLLPGSNVANATVTFVVNSTADSADAQLGDGLCDDGLGHCTLRGALMEANAQGGSNAIQFNIPGVGPHIIRPYAPLPAIIEGVSIDGYTQPGAQPNSNPAPQGLNTRLMIVLDGSQAGSAFAFAFGLDFPTIDGLVIRGLAIHSFGQGAIGGLYEEMYDVVNVRIVGNFIGTDATGTEPLGGSIYLAGGPRLDNIHIGGPNPEDRNLINGGVGIYSRYATDIQIQGNLIGTDVTGQHALGTGWGISVRDGYHVLIGGAETGATNVISGNRGHGITLDGNDGVTTIQNNLIGVAADGRSPLGNAGSGIYNLEHASVRIEGNQIAYNAGNGITVGHYSPTMILSLPNSIHNNGGLGIDLNDDGVTPNDWLDGDMGPNDLQNYPMLISVVHTADFAHVSGVLHSKPGQTYVLWFFANAQCDPSGYGEGETFVDDLMITTDSSGNAFFTAVLPQQAERPFVTATASSTSYQASSEFAQCRADPHYLVTLLATDVQQLVDDGQLSPATGARLRAKLDNAAAALLAGEENTAVLRLKEFITSVRNLMNRRQLPHEQGQPLIDAAWAIIHQITLP